MINKRIQEIREENNKSQEEFGEIIGVSGATISMYESGKRKPSKLAFLKICEKFNVNENWLRTGEGTPRKEISEEEELKMKLENALKGKSESLLNQLMCIVQMDAAELKILLNAGLQIHEFYKNEEYKKKINEKNVTK